MLEQYISDNFILPKFFVRFFRLGRANTYGTDFGDFRNITISITGNVIVIYRNKCAVLKTKKSQGNLKSKGMPYI